MSKQPLLPLILASGYVVSLLAFRIFWTGNTTYAFLLWNLFLAWIPLSLSFAVEHISYRKISAWMPWALTGLWILFFPNAAYILTDLGHLARVQTWDQIPLGYDVVMLLAFALTGLLVGFVSLWHMETIWRRFYGNRIATACSIGAIFLSAFGIYLGRFLRWNSWDLVTRPHALISDIAVRFVSPFDHPRTWAFMMLYFSFLFMIYLTIRCWHDPLSKSNKQEERS